MCKKSSCVVPVILLIIIACLCTYIFLCTDCKGKNSNSNVKQDTVEKVNYSYNDMKGFYSTKETVNIDSQNFTEAYTLYLSEDGTFRYEYVMNAPRSVMGNYTIVDDEIRLNYLFTSNSGAGIFATNGSKTLKIKDKNTLVDNNPNDKSQGDSKTINLVRDNSISNSYSSKEFNLNYLINNEELFNSVAR